MMLTFGSRRPFGVPKSDRSKKGDAFSKALGCYFSIENEPHTGSGADKIKVETAKGGEVSLYGDKPWGWMNSQ